ncbi:MAG: hypothetical protein H0T76_07825 [Nannocystis sp.]|nr:hypothetical protein [Nannocystis sp.]MBA3546373.1 hypothetical protein [Nannocystis sp.]
MIRTIVMGVCALNLGLLSACDQGAEAQKQATEAARKAAADQVAGKDREIAALKAELAQLSEKPAATTQPQSASPAGPNLDAGIVRAAATHAGVTKVKIEADADGSLRELSLYHNDEAALPAPVLALLAQQYPGAKIRAYETEFNRAHGRLFEVEVLTKDKQECEYSATPEGVIVYNECHIDPKTLPEPIRKAIPEAVPGAKILEAEKTTFPDGRETYSVELSAGGKVHELYFEKDALVRHELVITAQLEVPV